MSSWLTVLAVMVGLLFAHVNKTVHTRVQDGNADGVVGDAAHQRGD